MRNGLDFAWSKPSITAIKAGVYTFIIKHLSYDTTRKPHVANLTRSEADSYRANEIDVMSNWK